MRMASAKIMKALARFSTILATLLAGFAFVFATSVNAVAGDKKVVIIDHEKIEKFDGVNENLFFNRNVFVNRNTFVNRNVFFNRNAFNPFFAPFDDNEEFFFADRDEKFFFEDRFERDRDD